MVPPTLPLSVILSPTRCRVYTFTVILALCPVPFVLASVWKCQDSEPVRVPSDPFAFILRPVRVNYHPYPVWVSIFQRALVLWAIGKLDKSIIINIVFAEFLVNRGLRAISVKLGRPVRYSSSFVLLLLWSHLLLLLSLLLLLLFWLLLLFLKHHLLLLKTYLLLLFLFLLNLCLLLKLMILLNLTCGFYCSWDI